MPNTLSYKTVITDPEGTTGDYFGRALSIEGNTLAIGASEKTMDNVDNCGAIVLYTRSSNSFKNTKWTFSKYLSAHDKVANDYFGGSVSISGNKMVVGAPGNDSSKGKVYYYTRSSANETWNYVSTIQVDEADRETDALFGRSVTLDDDFLVIGASGDKNSNDKTGGKVYVYTLSNSNWSLRETIDISTLYSVYNQTQNEDKKITSAEGDKLGFSGAMNKTTLVIGAKHRNSYYSNGNVKFYNAGRVYYLNRMIDQNNKLTFRGWATTSNDDKTNDVYGTAVTLNDKYNTIDRNIRTPSALSENGYKKVDGNKNLSGYDDTIGKRPDDTIPEGSGLHGMLIGSDNNMFYYGTTNNNDGTGIVHVFEFTFGNRTKTLTTIERVQKHVKNLQSTGALNKQGLDALKRQYAGSVNVTNYLNGISL